MRFGLKRRMATIGALAVVVLSLLGITLAHVVSTPAPAVHAAAYSAPLGKPFCSARPQLCTETVDPWNYQGQYTGHDEPSLLYYSNVAGSGNSDLYTLVLPKDPPTQPAENGSGGTWNFQLHPTFWFGMALCDSQSAPNPPANGAGDQCQPDSDANIRTSTNPHSANYIGTAPGQAFMEMQFYPPGWGNVGTGISCGPDNTQWCAALNIDSASENENTGALNNNACLNAAGEEYVNYAIITKSGHSQAPADPLDQTPATFSTGPDTLEMNAGNVLTVLLHDTPAGFQVVIHDLSTGQTGSMTASIANGFGHPLFQPGASTCTDQPYAFHPLYSTSSPDTRVFWAAHSYNIAYSDEIGHYEYCSAQTEGACTDNGANGTDPGGNDEDDIGCSTNPIVQAVGDPPVKGSLNPAFTGCTFDDLDFDGPEYQHNWPGSNPNSATDKLIHAQPVTFTSPLFVTKHGFFDNYSQVAFENNLPRIEINTFSTNNDCQRQVYNPRDPDPGAGCIDPPNGASFYPIYALHNFGGVCVWQEGDAHIAGAQYPFGNTPTIEYGGLLVSNYPSTGNEPRGLIETFHRTVNFNPCPAPDFSQVQLRSALS
jgi:hypothetical protein